MKKGLILKFGITILGLLLEGCRSGIPAKHPSSSESEDEAKQTFKIDPIHVKATREKTGAEDDLRIDAYDASGLFERAAKHLRLGRCDEAIILYRRLANEFEASNLAPLSLYNSGLCNEHLNSYKESAADYLALIERYPESRDVTDALFRLAGSYEKLEEWNDAVDIFDKLLAERLDLNGAKRVEALARKGAALIQTNRFEEAKTPLKEVISIFSTACDLPSSMSSFYHGMARFKLGEIAEANMREAKIPSDEALLEEALTKKCELLLAAQQEYTQTIKIAHPHWAAAAAYRIGRLYRSLWEDMLAAPIPEDLDDESAAVYKELLKRKINVLLSKAVVQWERTLKMARRLNLNNEWVDKTAAELEEIRQILALKESDSKN